MREIVEKWIDKRKEEIANEERKRRARALINNGLYEKKEITKEEYKSGRRNGIPESEYVVKDIYLDDRTVEKYYRKYALELTDEEYNEVSKYFKNNTIIDENDGNGIGERIKKFSFAWLVLILIAGFIVAVCMAAVAHSFLVFIEIFGGIVFSSFCYFSFLSLV